MCYLNITEQSVQVAEGALAGTSYPVKQYADVIHLQGADAVAVYEQDFYAGSPAITVNKFGSGHAYYLAARFDEAFLADFYGWLADGLELKTAVTQSLPQGVSAQVRQTDTARYIFLLNFEPTAQTIKWDGSGTLDALSSQAVDNEMTLAGYGYRILKQTIGS